MSARDDVSFWSRLEAELADVESLTVVDRLGPIHRVGAPARLASGTDSPVSGGLPIEV